MFTNNCEPGSELESEARKKFEASIREAFGPLMEEPLKHHCWHQPQGAEVARFGADGTLLDAARGYLGPNGQERWLEAIDVEGFHVEAIRPGIYGVFA